MASTNSSYLTKNLADAYFTGTFKMMLTNTEPTETELDAQFRSGISTEITGTGYTSGGATITMTPGTLDTTNNRTPVTLGSVTWSSSTITAIGGYIYKDTGNASTDQMVTYVDFGGTKTSTGGDFTFTPSAPLYINR